MGDEELITRTIAGREMKLRPPTDDQLIGWMGVAGSLKDQAAEIDESDEDVSEMVSDIGLIFDAMLSSFVDEADRKFFRRQVILGKASISDLASSLITEPEEEKKSAPVARVRRR